MKTIATYHKSKVLLCALTSAAILAGCASTQNASLERARNEVNAAKTNPKIALSENASTILGDAEDELAKGDYQNELKTQFGVPVSNAEIEHQAYVTEQKVKLAESTAEAEAAAIQVALLQKERGQTVAETNALVEAELQRALTRAQELGAVVEREGNQIKVTFQDLTFDLNKAEIKAEWSETLDALGAALANRYPNAKVHIDGHTDTTGAADFNLDLSQRRAVAVQGFLVDKGVTADRITARGLGSARPIASNDTREGREKNRRVELVILGEPPQPQ